VLGECVETVFAKPCSKNYNISLQFSDSLISAPDSDSAIKRLRTSKYVAVRLFLVILHRVVRMFLYLFLSLFSKLFFLREIFLPYGNKLPVVPVFKKVNSVAIGNYRLSSILKKLQIEFYSQKITD
jgi:hypothetical protein